MTAAQLRDMVLEQHSRRQSDLIMSTIGTRKADFGKLFELALSDEPKVAARASWTVNHYCERHPGIVGDYLEAIIQHLGEHNVETAVKRNFTRVLEQMESYPTELMGAIFDISYRLLSDPDEGNVVRVYAMTILGKICLVEPDLIDEVKLLIKKQSYNSSAAFSIRSRRVLSEFRKVAN